MITFSDNIARKPYLGSTEIAEVWLGNVKVYPDTNDYSRQYLTFEVVDGGTIEFVATDASVSKTISFSLDNGQTWTDLTSSTSYQSMGGTLSAGDKVLVKGTNNTYASNDRSYYNHFASTAKVNIYGNIMSLISGDDFVDNKTLTEINTFYRLFSDNSKLLSAKHLILPATTLTNYCYSYMFQNCANFTTAPSVLPATTLTNGCYMNMFSGCSSLVNAPALPATTLANNCYRDMFNGCTSLTTAPKLPATTLANNCYMSMFQNCTSLTTAPVLPARTLADSCYSSMFQDCSNLNYIKAMFTTTPSGNYTMYWVNGVASTGTFVKNSAATWDVTGVNGVPTGWTIKKEYVKINKKYRATYTNQIIGTTVDGDCDGNNLIINEVTKSGLKTLVIGECVPAIVGECFADCANLTSVIIEGNTSIDHYSFARNNGHLTSITMYSTTPPPCQPTAFTYYNGSSYVPMTSITIYVPSQSVNAYKTASGWSRYSSKIKAIS